MERPSKRQAISRPSSELSRSPTPIVPKELEMTTEVLTLIIDYAAQGDKASLIEFAIVSKVFATVALPLLRKELSINGWDKLIKVSKHFKKLIKAKRGGVMETKLLDLKLETIYPTSMNNSLNTLRSLFNSSFTALTSLSISLPSNSHNPLPHLLKDDLSFLTQLTELRVFEMKGGIEIWYKDLLTLLSNWSKLKILYLSNLRGDCGHSINSLSSLPKISKLVIIKTSLNGKMIQTLLSNQTELKCLEIPLPGSNGVESNEIEGRLAWGGIEKLVIKTEQEGEGESKLEILKVWDRWGSETAAKKRKEVTKKNKKLGIVKKGTKKPGVAAKGKGKAKAKIVELDPEEGEETDQLDSDNDDNDSNSTSSTTKKAQQDQEEEEEEEPELPSSPFLPLVSSPSNSLRSLLLTTAYLPSSPSPDSFLELLPHLTDLTSLTIEDNTSSGLRKIVEKAIKGKKLMNLEELISVGIKKRGGGAGTKKKKTDGKTVTVAKGKGKGAAKKKEETDSEDDTSEVDELDSSDSSDDDEEDDRSVKGKVAVGGGKKKKKDEAEIEEENALKQMSKPEKTFYEFCKSHGIVWRIREMDLK